MSESETRHALRHHRNPCSADDRGGVASWQEVSVGDERALRRIDSGVIFLFGLGPARRERDHEARVSQLLASLTPRPRAVRWCQQVHGELLASLSEEPDQRLTGVACAGRCDGLITAESGLGLVVWSADCVPLLLAGGGVVAAVHAGWRGAAAGVVTACLRRLQVEYGVLPRQLQVHIGPAVAPCHYQVGPEVISALLASGVPAAGWLHQDRVDLRALLSSQLTLSGVPRHQVWQDTRCTACDETLASYRRDGAAAGRQWSLVYRPEESRMDRD